MTDAPPLCKCGQPCVRVLGGSFQRLCQPCIAALPRPARPSALGAKVKRLKRDRHTDARVRKDAYTALADIVDEEDALMRQEERRRR